MTSLKEFAKAAFALYPARGLTEAEIRQFKMEFVRRKK